MVTGCYNFVANMIFFLSGKNVNWKAKALECDSCKTWFYVKCQGGIKSFMYDLMDASHIPWHCLNCGLPNLSSTFFNTSENISVSEYSFSSLEDVQSPGVPNASSSSIHRP